MKLYTPDGSILMEVTTLETNNGLLIIKGQIMGTMPLTAELRPSELRKAFLLIRPSTIWCILRMLFTFTKRESSNELT